MDKNFDKAVKYFININKENRKKYYYRFVDKVNRYWQEFATVAIDAGRGSGKTSFVKRNAVSDDLVICYHATHDRKPYDALVIFANRINYSEFINFISGRKFNNVFIDEPALIVSKWNISLNQIYEDIIPHLEDSLTSTFVLLGKVCENDL